MALLDRVKDAARPTNTIEGMPTPDPSRPVADLHGANRALALEPQQAAKKPAGDAKAPAYTTEPEAIARAYYVEDRGQERRYFDDYQRKALAIRSTETSINTKREDLNTIRAMMTMAESRGWSEVKVSGTADFKREAWIEAQARGITAQGHKPSDLDRQEADRRRAERGQEPVHAGPNPGTNEVRQAVAGQAAQAVPAAPQAAQAAAVASQQRDGEAPRPTPDLHGANRAPVQQQASTSRSEAAPQAVPAVQVPAQQAQATAPQQAAPVSADHRKTLKEATAELSPDGKLVLAALSEKIDRQMNKLNAEAKLETKAFAATELVKKERAEGPVVLTAEQRKLATAPEPVREQKPAQKPEQQPEQQRLNRGQSEQPRISRRR